MQSAIAVSSGVDAYLTQDCLNRNECVELNPLVRQDDIWLYWMGANALNIGIAHVMPKKYRTLFQGIVLGASVGANANHLYLRGGF